MKKWFIVGLSLFLWGCSQSSMQKDANKVVELIQNTHEVNDLITLEILIESLNGKYQGADLLEFQDLIKKKIDTKLSKGEDFGPMGDFIKLIMGLDISATPKQTPLEDNSPPQERTETDFFTRLERLKIKAGHTTWGDECLDTEDIEWLMTLTDREILDKILKDKAEMEDASQQYEQQDTSSTNASKGIGGLNGRQLIGTLPRPSYSSDAQGAVVVSITVDSNGDVVSAKCIPEKSTTDDAELITAALDAAKKARFTPSDGDMQTGTITYIFRLN